MIHRTEDEIRNAYDAALLRFAELNPARSTGEVVESLSALTTAATLAWILDIEFDEVSLDSLEAMKYVHRENPTILAKYLGAVKEHEEG